MKWYLTAGIATVTFLALLALQVEPAAQGFSAAQKRQARHRLIDLGTFARHRSSTTGASSGGPTLPIPIPTLPIAITWSALSCRPTSGGGGVLTDLVTLPYGFGSEGNWINERRVIAGQSLNNHIDPLLGLPAASAVLWKRNGEIVNLRGVRR
jgi:hypothetical protein